MDFHSFNTRRSSYLFSGLSYFDFSESFVRVINKLNTLQHTSKFVCCRCLEVDKSFLHLDWNSRNSTLSFWATIYFVKTLSWTIWWMFPTAIDSRLESSVRVGCRLSKVCTHFYSSRSLNFTANTTTALPTLESLSHDNDDGNGDVTWKYYFILSVPLRNNFNSSNLYKNSELPKNQISMRGVRVKKVA